MKKKTKRLLILISVLLIAGIIYTIYTSVSDHSDSHKGHDHNHSSDKDGCMCECEFSSNQNETSCKKHGGCQWVSNKCITAP